MFGLQAIVGGVLSVIVYTLVIVTVYRVFQIASDVREMKELLKAIKRNTTREGSQISATEPVPTSAEALVRAVHAASYEDVEQNI